MAPSLGKRKRRDQIDSMANVSESCTEDDSAHLQALSRRHFEATFEPLQSLSLSCTGRDIGTDTYNEEPESDWNGFSEDEENRVETIQYATYPKPTSEIPKDEIKIFTVRAMTVYILNHQH